MIFQADAAFALELIALVLGLWILIKVRSKEVGNLKGFGSFVGYFVIVSAFLALLCTGYYTVKYWEDGRFSQPAQGQMMMGGHSGMMMNQMSGNRHGNMKGKMGMDPAKCEKMMKVGTMEGTMMNENMDHDMGNHNSGNDKQK